MTIIVEEDNITAAAGELQAEMLEDLLIFS